MSQSTTPVLGGTIGRGRGRGIGLKSPPAGSKLSLTMPNRNSASLIEDVPDASGAAAGVRASQVGEAEPAAPTKQLPSPRGFREATPTAIPSRSDGSLGSIPLRGSDSNAASPRGDPEVSPRGVGRGPSSSELAMRTSPRKMDTGKGDDGHSEHVAYLEGLVSSLNLRVAEFDRQVEQLTAELDEARALLAERQTGGGLARESSAPLLSRESTAGSLSRESQSVPALDADQQKKRGWVGTMRRTGTSTSASSAPVVGAICKSCASFANGCVPSLTESVLR